MDLPIELWMLVFEKLDAHDLLARVDPIRSFLKSHVVEAEAVAAMPAFEKRTWHYTKQYYHINQASREAAHRLDLTARLLRHCKTPPAHLPLPPVPLPETIVLNVFSLAAVSTLFANRVSWEDCQPQPPASTPKERMWRSTLLWIVDDVVASFRSQTEWFRVKRIELFAAWPRADEEISRLEAMAIEELSERLSVLADELRRDNAEFCAEIVVLQ